jgi:hypothetical protein
MYGFIDHFGLWIGLSDFLLDFETHPFEGALAPVVWVRAFLNYFCNAAVSFPGLKALS